MWFSKLPIGKQILIIEFAFYETGQPLDRLYKKNESGIITAYVRKSERSNIESHSCDLRPPVLASTCLDAVFGSDMSLTEK